MKIIAINGSPQGIKSSSYQMVEAVLKGAQEAGATTEHVLLSQLNIHPCIGCFCCWTKTPGVCVFHDDREKIDLTKSDLVIYATPVFVANISGLLKNFLDRGFAHIIPSIAFDKTGQAIHPHKHSSQKIMVISNCGYPGQENFDVLKLFFRKFARIDDHTNLIAEIYRDQGPLLKNSDPQFLPIIEKYKSLLYQAGKEVVQNLSISEQTQKLLEEPLIPYDVYLKLHNQFFKNYKI